MDYIKESEELTGYKVKTVSREAFYVTGYTLIVPPASGLAIPRFWDEVVTDGRLDRLVNASSGPTWVLGLGSWDPGCPKGGQRYTICIERTELTNFTSLADEYTLFTKQIGASDWMCFEMTAPVHLQQGRRRPYLGTHDRFWEDNPYKMMKKLGYEFNNGDFSIGLHFDAYPPGFGYENPAMEFWITVRRPQAAV